MKRTAKHSRNKQGLHHPPEVALHFDRLKLDGRMLRLQRAAGAAPAGAAQQAAQQARARLGGRGREALPGAVPLPQLRLECR